MKRAVMTESAGGLSVTLAASCAENARLREEGQRVAASVESMHTALRHALRASEEDELAGLSSTGSRPSTTIGDMQRAISFCGMWRPG